MKKLLTVLLTALMVFTLVGCSSSKEETVATEGGEEVAALKAGFIFLHDENSTYDKNFLEAAEAACKELGIEYEFKTNVPEGQECYEAAVELVDAGCDFIFADSFGHEDYIIEAAKEFPEVQFAHATGTKAHTENLSNYHNAFASIYEGRYLAGVAAGLKLNEMIDNKTITADQAKMGYVGAFPYAEVVSGYTSFYLGAKSVCPTVTMDVTYTNSWYDQPAEQTAAELLINDGAVLVSQHADSMGAPSACENAGVPNVSYNGSTESAAPNTFIISSKINWAPYFVYAINCISNGEAIDTDWTGTVATNSVQVTALGAKAPAAGTQEKLDEVKAGLADGSIKVFDTTTFTVGGAEMTTYMADVDSDPAYTGDTEVIINGEFAESQFRSAPYFDLRIDGITEK